MFEDEILERENANWRISQDGLGAELIRRAGFSELIKRLEPFLAHIGMVDIVALNEALRLQELGPERGGTSTLVEAYLRILAPGLSNAPKNGSSPGAANSEEHTTQAFSDGARRATA